MVESSTQLSNADFENIRDPEIVEIFEKYFSKSIISMGALTRKLPFLLLSLAQFTKSNWSALGEYNDETKTFKVTFSGRSWNSLSTEVERIIIENKPATRSGITNVFNLVNRLFSKDKWTPYSVVSSTVRLKKSKGRFLYTKERYRSKEKLFYFEIKPEPVSVFEKVKHLFSHDQSDVILDHEVVECSKSWKSPAA